MEHLELFSEGWSVPDVVLAASFRERWKGVKDLPEGASLLIRTRSVHGFGLETPLLLVAMNRELRVSAVRELRPGGLVCFPRARFLLEMPVGSRAPDVGARIEMSRV